MIRSTIKRILKKAVGRDDKPAPSSVVRPPDRPEGSVPVNPPSAGKAASRPRTPPPAPAEDRGHSHDHGHSHSHSHGHSHSHSHSHDDEEPAAPKRDITVMAEETPNPNAMKFTVNVKVKDKGSVSFNSAEEVGNDPLGAALFEVAGVRSIFGVNDFVTVTKEADADWGTVVPGVEAALKQVLG